MRKSPSQSFARALLITLTRQVVSDIPWLLNEDAALKKKLQGLQVFDGNASNGRGVPVRYRLPQDEVADLTFPIIVIQHDAWTPAEDRMHDGYINMPYAPEGFDPWWNETGNPATSSFNPNDSPYYGFFPIPYNLDYTVTVYARMMQEHMMPLVAALAQYNRLHPKFGFLDVPQDGTIRTMQLLGSALPQVGKDNDGKRIFWTQYRVRVFSELLPNITVPVPATLINLDLSVYQDITDLSVLELTESKGLLSVGASTAWNVAAPVY